MFCHSFRDLAAKKNHTVSKNFHEVYQNYILAVLRKTSRVFLKKLCFYRFRKLSIFIDFFRKLFDRLSKLLYSSCPEKNFHVEILFNFSIFLKFLYQFQLLVKFFGTSDNVFQQSCQNCISCAQTIVLRQITNCLKKTFLLKCSCPLRKKIVDSGQKVSSRVVSFVFQVSRVFFREKKFLRLRPYQSFLSVLDRNFFGSLVKVSQLTRQNCCGDV